MYLSYLLSRRSVALYVLCGDAGVIPRVLTAEDPVWLQVGHCYSPAGTEIIKASDYEEM